MFYSKKLKKFKEINHCFFSKKNGFSKGIYRSLNCGKGSKDSKKNILKNLNYVKKKMFLKKNNLILMHQTHSNKVMEIKKKLKESKGLKLTQLLLDVKAWVLLLLQQIAFQLLSMMLKIKLLAVFMQDGKVLFQE